MRNDENPSLVDYLSGFDSVVEVGVGDRYDVATALSERGCSVTVTDVYPRSPPADVTFVRDDVTDPTRSVYRGADAIYARRLPPELQRPTLDLADSVDAAFLFTTLGGDPSVVPSRPKQGRGTTIMVARRIGEDGW